MEPTAAPPNTGHAPNGGAATRPEAQPGAQAAAAAQPAQAPAANGAITGLTPASGNSDPRRRLGDVIVELGYADRELVEQVLAKEAESNEPMGELLTGSGIVSSRDLAHALAERNGLDFVDLDAFAVDQAAVRTLGAEDAKRYRAVPVATLPDGSLLVATADPSNVLAMDDISMSTGQRVHRAIAPQAQIDSLVSSVAASAGPQPGASVEAPQTSGGATAAELSAISTSGGSGSIGEAPVVKLVHSIITDAVERGASDIHFDATREEMRVRMRVDGVVLDPMTVPAQLVPGLVSRIKIMSELDIAERRVPQDGRVALQIDGRNIDIRVSTLPVIRGESVVMRILDKDRVVLDPAQLGMREADQALVMRAVGAVHGSVLVTGPTGAGKTTTLYALLQHVNTPDRTVISIEDPVEYEVDGIKQIHVNRKAGLSFASGLRSMLRSDPDTLMVGEIRDSETAQIAMEAALTGHLVLSTLHTNSAATAAARLIEMGIEPYLVASGVECVIAQRLARRLCEACRRPVSINPAELGVEAEAAEGAEPFQAYEAAGCAQCSGTGYRGRIGLYEVLSFDERVRAVVLEKGSGEQIAAAARAAGMRSLRDDGLAKAREGVTSVAEVLRVLGSQ